MFSSISSSVIVNRPLALVSSVDTTVFSAFDSSVCSASSRLWSLPYLLAASLAPERRVLDRVASSP